MHTRNKIFMALIITALLAALVVTLPSTIGAGAHSVTSRHSSQSRTSQQKNTQKSSQIASDSTLIQGDFILQSNEIDGTDAHLQILPDPLQPVLVFSFSVMHGMSLSHPITNTTSLVISSQDDVAASSVAIKTSVFSDLKTAIGSFTNKFDLLKLTAGFTVHHLVMTNVTLRVDSYIQAQDLSISNFQMQVVNN